MDEWPTCQVKACSGVGGPILEMCASHWWSIPRTVRAATLRARTAGQNFGIHPSTHYLDQVEIAVAHCNYNQGNLAKYEREDGDISTRQVQNTFCTQCQGVKAHIGLKRDGVSFLVCSECESMIPATLPGARLLPGMETNL